MANLSRCCSPPEHFPTRRSAIWVIPARSSTSAAGLLCANRLAVYCTVSETVRSFSSPPVCITAETRPGVPAEDERLPGRLPGQAEDDVDGGGLARAVRPEHRHDFSRRDAHVDIPDRLHGPEMLPDVL